MIVTTNNPDLMNQAMRLADSLQLDFATSTLSTSANYALVLTENHLALSPTKIKHIRPFYIDFSNSKLEYRRLQATLKRELLARAINIHPTENPIIIDATAGLGRDSYILASLGYNITMLERSPIVHALLTDAIDRATFSSIHQPIVERLNLIQTDALNWLQQTDIKPDVIYLDPMFPERNKSASVKKEMAFLQDIIGPDMDADELFKVALSCAAKRVVVKRPRKAPNICEQAPNYTLTGKSSRFDIYLA